MLQIIKQLDKENTSLRETKKSNHENIQTCKEFLKSFQTERKKLQQKNKQLELENNSLLDELRKLNNNEQLGNVSADSPLNCGKNIENGFSKDSGSIIETLVNEGLLSFPCLF